MARSTAGKIPRGTPRLFALVAYAVASWLPAQPSTQAPQPTPTPMTVGHATPVSRKPVIAVVGDAAGVELTDFVVPRATLAESGVAQVLTVAARAAKIPLRPGTMTIDPDMTFAAFDTTFPKGADYVVVPAMHDADNAAVRAWLQAQAARGATIVSICEGARVVAGAGLLDGRRATTHWHALEDYHKRFPRTTWVRDSRYVVDDHRISTAGVSASLPASLFLVERIAGRAVADSVARRIGVASFDSHHDTGAFRLSKSLYLRGLGNSLAWWRHDVIAVPVADGVDEVALALSMDAIPRTMRAKALTWSDASATVVGRQGLRMSVDCVRRSLEPSVRTLALPAGGTPPAGALDSAIVRLAAWYGNSARDLISLGMEYPLRGER